MSDASEPPGPPSATDKQSAAPGPGLAHIERTFLRLTFWQTLLSLAGVFTGAVALYAALTESQAVREQTAASVWPYVQMMMEDTDDGERARFALSFENVGVGPARMQGMSFSFAGEPVLDWEEAAKRLLTKSSRVGVDYGRASVSRRVIAPGESVTAFQTSNRELAVAMQQAVYGGQVVVRYCFCSIFDQCWIFDGSEEAARGTLADAAACPEFGDEAFRD